MLELLDPNRTVLEEELDSAYDGIVGKGIDEYSTVLELVDIINRMSLSGNPVRVGGPNGDTATEEITVASCGGPGFLDGYVFTYELTGLKELSLASTYVTAEKLDPANVNLLLMAERILLAINESITNFNAFVTTTVEVAEPAEADAYAYIIVDALESLHEAISTGALDVDPWERYSEDADDCWAMNGPDVPKMLATEDTYTATLEALLVGLVEKQKSDA